MTTRNTLLGSTVLVITFIGMTLVILGCRTHSQGRESKPIVATTNVIPDSNQEPVTSITYKTAASMRTATSNTLILCISTNADNFVREKMIMLARQLNQDFPDEQRLLVTLFDSETAAQNYSPVGGSYYISKKLERGEYFLDRTKGREYISFSSERGRAVDEIRIVMSGKIVRRTTKKKR